MKLRELFVELGIEADTRKVKEFDNSLQEVRSSMRELVSWAGRVGVALAGAFGGMAFLTKQHAEFAEEAIRTADAFRMSTDTYQELRFAFQSLNASSDDFHDVLQSIQRSTWRAERGIKTYTDSLAVLGLTYRDLQGLDADVQFQKVVDGAREASAAGRDVSAQLSQMFGADLSRRVLPGILSVEGSFEKFRRIARDSGLVIEEELLEQAAQAQLSFRTLGATLIGMSRLIGIRLAPGFHRLSDAITRALLNSAQYFNELLGRFSDFFEEEVSKFIIYFERLNNFVQGTLGGWGNVVKGVVLVFGLFQSAIGGLALKKLFAALKLAKVGLLGLIKPLVLASAKALAIAGLFILLVLVVEDLIGYFSGVDSSIGSFIERLKETEGPVGFFGRLLEQLLNKLGGLIAWFSSLVGGIIASFSDLGFELSGLIDVLQFIATIVITNVMTKFTIAFGMIAGAIAAVLLIVRGFITALSFVGDGFEVIGFVGKKIFAALREAFEPVLEAFEKAGGVMDFFKSAGGIRGAVDFAAGGISNLVRGEGWRGEEEDRAGRPSVQASPNQVPSRRSGDSRTVIYNQDIAVDMDVDGADPEKMTEEVARNIAQASGGALQFDYLSSQYDLDE